MTHLFGDSEFIWFFVLSILLLMTAVLATIRTEQKYQEFPDKFETLTNSEWQSDPPNRLLSNRIRGIGILVVAIMAVYPYLARLVADTVAIDLPYLLRIAPKEGPLLQIAIGLLFWAPALTLIAAGTAKAAYYTRTFRHSLGEVELASTKDGLRTLMQQTHAWFFRFFQEALLLWGTTAGIGIWLVLYTRDELAVRLGASMLVVLALAVGFLLPLVALARWVAAQSAAFEAALQEKKMDVMLSYLDDGNDVSETGIPAQEADALIGSLPPSNPVTILWEQVLRSLVALAGPFMSSFSKVVDFLGINVV